MFSEIGNLSVTVSLDIWNTVELFCLVLCGTYGKRDCFLQKAASFVGLSINIPIFSIRDFAWHSFHHCLMHRPLHWLYRQGMIGG